jgi:hypothetical protein
MSREAEGRVTTKATQAAWLVMGLAAFGTGAASHARDRTAAPETVPVRYTEGTVHGFLKLTTEAGTLLAHGDLLQVVTDGGIERRMVFQFRDGSLFDEAVTFTQRGVFSLQTYHLIQSGPAFAADLEASLSRSGTYTVRTKSHADGKPHTYEGTLALPHDLYNGMETTVAMNMPSGNPFSVHIVAFSPEPHVIGLEFAPSGTESVRFDGHPETAVRFTVKPKLGFLLGLGAKLTGKSPPDSHLWIVTDDVPAFVKSDGWLYSGPVWRVSLTSPTAP